MKPLLKRLWADDSGQDIIEYALITAAIGVVGIATWPAIEAGIGATYRNYDSKTQNLWEPLPPGGGGS